MADNVNINRVNVAESRRGFNYVTHDLPNLSDRMTKLFVYQNTLLGFYGTSLGHYDSSTGWAAYTGSIAAVSGAFLQSAEISKNIYFNTSTGLKKLSAYTDAALATAGCPKALDLTAANNATSTWLANGSIVAYKVVFGIRDGNNNLIRGSTSQRLKYTNSSGGTGSVDLTIQLPGSQLSTNHFVQVFRTPAVTSGEPSAEYQLCYEGSITSGEISANSKVVNDILSDALLGESLYTNESQQGAAAENYQPPLARDIAEFRNYLFFAYPTQKYRCFMTLIGTGATGTGLQVNDTVVIAGQTYTGKAAETAASKEFKVSTAGTPSQNIEDTAKSLCRVVNKNASSTVYAYYLSNPSELPGKMLFEEISLGGAVFTFNSSRKTAWDKDLTNAAISATNDTYKNRIMFSKAQQPEAVPLANYLDCGSSNNEIKRIIKLRDSLFIIGTEGIYTLRGNEQASFVVDLLDNTAKIYAPETVCVINNLVYFLADIGVVMCSETSVKIVSLPIKDALLNLYGPALTQVKAYSFGVAYQSEGKYLLHLPSSASDTYASQAYVLDVFSNQWCRWTDYTAVAGLVNFSDDKLYLAAASSNKVMIERKALDFTDYADYGGALTITAKSGYVLTLSDASGLEIGDLIVQGTVYGYVETVDVIANTVTIDIDTGLFSLAACTWDKGIECVIQWNPEFSGNPAGLKHFSECLFLFKRAFIKAGTATFSSDVNPSTTDVTLTAATGTGNWGDFDWGDIAWGGDPATIPLRTLVPRNAARSSQITVKLRFRVAYNDFQLNGVSLVFNPTGTRIGR